MNQQKNLIVLTVLSVASMSFAVQEAENRLKKSVEDASPMKLYQILEGAKIVAFSKDYLIKDGLSDKDLKNWNDVTRVANDLVRSAVTEKKAPASYVGYVDEFGKVATFFKESVDALHYKYSSVFSSLKGGTARFELEKTFSDNELKEIKNISDSSASYKKQMSDINSVIFKQILQDAVPPKSWVPQFYTKAGMFTDGGELIDANKVLKDYQKIIALYETEKDFRKFLQSQNISKKTVEKFVADLQGIEYIMKAKLLAQATETETKDYKKRSHNIDMVKEMITKLHDEFPDLITPLEFAQLAETMNKSAMIIFAQSGTYSDILGQLTKDSTYLYSVAKSKVVRK